MGLILLLFVSATGPWSPGREGRRGGGVGGGEEEGGGGAGRGGGGGGGGGGHRLTWRHVMYDSRRMNSHRHSSMAWCREAPPPQAHGSAHVSCIYYGMQWYAFRYSQAAEASYNSRT